MLAEKSFTEELASLTTEDPLRPLCRLPAVCATSAYLNWVSMHTAPTQMQIPARYEERDCKPAPSAVTWSWLVALGWFISYMIVPE